MKRCSAGLERTKKTSKKVLTREVFDSIISLVSGAYRS